jgi:hypothetical protein
MTEQMMDTGPPQVGIHEDDFPGLIQGQERGNAHCNQRFSFVGSSAGNGNALDLAFRAIQKNGRLKLPKPAFGSS